MRLLLILIGGGSIMAGLILLPIVPEWFILASCLVWLIGCVVAGLDG